MDKTIAAALLLAIAVGAVVGYKSTDGGVISKFFGVMSGIIIGLAAVIAIILVGWATGAALATLFS